MPRPRALDDNKRREIYALLSTGCDRHTAARHVGCSARTIRREALRDPEFADQLNKAEAACRVGHLRAIRHAAKSDWRAAAWLHESGKPDPFARPHPARFLSDEHEEQGEPEPNLLEIVGHALGEAKSIEDAERVARELAQLASELRPVAHAARKLRDLQTSCHEPSPGLSSQTVETAAK